RIPVGDQLMKPLRSALVVVMLVCYAAISLANEIVIDNAKLQPADGGGYSLSANFDLSLSNRLENVLSQGVPLYFTVEFECYRPRWDWFDASVSNKSYQLRLSFHALTRT